MPSLVEQWHQEAGESGSLNQALEVALEVVLVQSHRGQTFHMQ